MQHGGIDVTPEILRELAEFTRSYAVGQYRKVLEYYHNIRSLESEIQTIGFQNMLDEVLRLCKEADEHRKVSMEYYVKLCEKADLLEIQGDFYRTNILQEKISANELPTDKLRATRLAVTQQTTQIRSLSDGRRVSVFDHPEEAAKTAVYGQGYAMVEGKRYAGTCGICALATILRRAGIPVDEQKVLVAAVKQNLCCNVEDVAEENAYQYRGGTYDGSRRELAAHFMLEMDDEIGRSLETLAEYVEKGHGVIIAVQAGKDGYNPDNRYFGAEGGHAIVLNSVERDLQTGAITAYYVIDSNGTDPASAGIRIPAEALEYAYMVRGCRANVTTNIIW